MSLPEVFLGRVTNYLAFLDTLGEKKMPSRTKVTQSDDYLFDCL